MHLPSSFSIDIRQFLHIACHLFPQLYKSMIKNVAKAYNDSIMKQYISTMNHESDSIEYFSPC